MLPEDMIKMRARKVVDNGTGPFAIPLAQLTESIITNDKLDQLLAKEAPEMPEFPEIEMPEYPTEITVSNLPDVQKVEITNLPNEKDDKEQLALLKEIASELKKKEQYAYDIEIDSTLKAQLKGDKGDNGSPDTANQIADKLNTLEGEVELSVLKGWKEFIANLGEKTTATRVYGTRMLQNLIDVIGAKEATTGQVLTKQADGTFAFETPTGGGGSGSGDVVGPASAVNNNFAAFDTTTGKLIKDSGSNASSFATSTQGTKADNAVVANTAITGATKTKITYDAKGLVTAGADATTADIADSLNKRYVTDANLIVIGNTSGTNSGDNAVNTLYSGLVSNATHTGDATGSVALTLATVNSNVGSFGLAGSVAQFTVNAKGLITAAANVAISITSSAVSDFSTAVAALITGKADKTTTISTTAPLSGGGDLSANRTLTTSMNTNKLIGRGTAGTGVFEEITLGTNLSLSGTTLNATGGGSGGTITTQDEGSTLSTTVTTLNFTGAGVTASGSGATTTIDIPGGGGSGSLTKGIAEVDFGVNTTQSDIATVSVTDATVTSTSYPSVSMYALATTDHDPDDYMAEGLIPYITNVQNGVGFDISVRAPNMTFGKYKVTYQF